MKTKKNNHKMKKQSTATAPTKNKIMAKKIILPIVTKEKTFNSIDELYEYYYSVDPVSLTEFSKQFWAEGINLVELIHNPESFTIVPATPATAPTEQGEAFNLDNMKGEFKNWLNNQDALQVAQMNTDKIFLKFINWMLKQPGLYGQISNVIWEWEKENPKIGKAKAILSSINR